MPGPSLNPGVSITTRSGHTAAWGISPLMNIGNNWSRLRSPDMINFPKRLVDQKRGQGQQALRRLALQGTTLARAQCDTLRLKLLKVGVQVRISVRKVWLAFAESYPYAALFEQVLTQLKAIPLRC